MSYQIKFFNKSWSDFETPSVVATASEGQTYAYLPFNRSNLNAWQTTGSADANNTTYVVDFGTTRSVHSLILLIHNFKAFTVKYWNGTTYVDFSTPIAETANTASSSFYSFTSVDTNKIKITITACMVVDDDKFLFQFIATTLIGQLAGWPIISKHNVSKNRVINQMLSGKSVVFENTGFFSCNLSVERWTSNADLTIVEALYNSTEGFLVSLCGGSETQFKTTRQGYRKQDLFLMKCTNEYSADYYSGIYNSGVNISIDLMEVTT